MSVFLVLVYLCCLGAYSLCSASSSNVSMSESKTESYARLYNDIVSRPVALYKIRPGLENDFQETFPMTFYLEVLDIYDVDEINSVMSLNAYIIVNWTQTELAWNASEYNGLDWITVDNESIWIPKIAVVKGQKESYTVNFDKYLILHSDGTVETESNYYLSFGCEVDFLKYPFDSQVCSVGFVLRNGFAHVTVAETTIKRAHTNKGEWILYDVQGSIKQGQGDPRRGGDPTYTFFVKRIYVYYVITFVFPMVLTSLMIPVVFLIPAHAGEKLSYLVAIFTSTAIYLNYISDVMPRSLSSLPYLAVLLLEVLVEGFLATLASLLVVSLYYREERARKKLSRTVATFGLPAKETKDPRDVTGPVVGFSETGSQGCLPFHIKSSKLDLAFFCLFAGGQVIFLITLFGISGWL